MITPRWLAWHAFTIATVFGMLWLGNWQFHRAENGNALSWAYTFEWPIFAAFGLVFWVKTILDEAKPKQAAGDANAPTADDAAAGLPPAALRRAGPAAGDAAGEDEGDPELDEYNAYLARLSKQAEGHGRWHGLR
ncbi:MAG TPA: hypothetical protein VFV41_26500 [Streptosporangiaceae bacterium]|nr:hypothetical protein [Streptosporangiaceae bacterium]